MTDASLFPPAPLTVTEVTQLVRTVVEEAFPDLWVTGEISNLARPRSGHVYFTLKDAHAQLRVVVWRSQASRLRFTLEDGLEIIVHGRLTVYEARGEYQLVADKIDPVGIGELELALRQLREKLSKKGYFAQERKKPLPSFPQRIALVTSPSGAAVRDMLEILQRRWPAAEVWICPVPVQGETAAPQIAAMIRRLNRYADRIDVMIVGRGGGSLEDLWPFNEEIVVEAIYESKIPVVSAVGHEIDLTLADLVADRRALTPSEAAEIVVPNREDLAKQLETALQRLKQTLSTRIERAKRRLNECLMSRALRYPLEAIRDRERQVDELSEKIDALIRRRVESGESRLRLAASRLEALSPLAVLRRGYSITRDSDGRVVRSIEQVRPGQELETVLYNGTVRSRVESVGHDAPLPSTDIARIAGDDGQT